MGIVIFKRKIKIVESETNGFNDENLKSQEVIFAWGDNFDNDNTPIYHGTAARDNKLVNILQTNNVIDENSFFQNKVVLKENFYDLHWNFTVTDVTFKIVVKK